ncbi:hypothetical protein GCM10023201_59280 [Actinomycetospora corticicola]|uniref:Histidine phosphatase family protein n=1 Tax=Actinomycetospora corticicola TaxID=663602 RepID=A0A7Y9E2J1_9PSEU|nr:hypothetical protein [Actinomycetospora corticicola]NYD39707.1 hypothetical protein [Actinomycetospora corticicola]
MPPDAAPLRSRRAALGVLAAGLAVPALAACSSGHHHAEAAVASATVGAPRPGTTIMIVRHAEKPAGSTKGVDADGSADEEGLTARGWSRAGALATLFAPLVGPVRAGLVRPTALLASDPGSDGSRRPEQTLTEVSATLRLPVSATIRKSDHAGIAAALVAAGGAPLVAWQHQDIPGIVAALGTVAPTPPAVWPGDRFDVVWILRAQGDGWSFTQVPQLLLAGDSPEPITTAGPGGDDD